MTILRVAKMYRRFALGIVVVIAALGIIFIGLDIEDIGEGFRLHLPTPILNTIFIFAVAVFVAYLSARSFAITGSPQMLWLGCGALAFGIGSLLRGWLVVKGLNVPITSYDCAALIASVLHLIGAGLSMAKLRKPDSGFRRKPRMVIFCYLGILVAIALVTWAALRGVIPPFFVPGKPPTLIRSIVVGMTELFFFAAALIYLSVYAKLRTDFLYWYSLGLMLFAFGLVFISQGAIDSRLAWLGRVSQYAGGIYFLVAVLGTYRPANLGFLQNMTTR